jgi:alpha-tubulin suppressor-like RCC1 family protein
MIGVMTLAACRDASVAPPRGAGADRAISTGAASTLIIPGPAASSSFTASMALAPEEGGAPPKALANILEIGSGSQYSCALRNDGLVFCWGDNRFGNLGNGSLVGTSRALEVSGSTRFTHLEVGDANACGLTASGAAYCWGDNSSGQLGTGTVGGNSTVPVAVSGGLQFQQLSIGLRSICGVATDGTTYCWGSNIFAQLGNGAIGGNVSAPQPVASSNSLGFVEVSPGFFNSCALTASGALYCWGGNGPRFGNGVSSPQSLVPTPSGSGMTFQSVDMGNEYVCARTAANDGFCWGVQNFGQAGVGNFSQLLSPTPIVGTFKFSALDAHHSNSFIAFTCGLDTVGRAFCWGANDKGQLGSPGVSTCTFGSLPPFNCSSRPRQVPDGRRYVGLGTGLDHSCAVEVGGEVYCWGDNVAGQLGNGGNTPSSRPVRVVRLNAPPENGSVVVTPLSGQLLYTGATLQFSAQALGEDGVPLVVQPAFQWVSSNPSAATIDPNGLATAVATGSTIISARVAGGGLNRASLGIQVQDPVALFQRAWSGAQPGIIFNNDGLVVLGGLLTDEWTHSGTFPGRRAVDQRSIPPTTDQELGRFYFALDFARFLLEHEEGRLQTIAPADPRRGELLALSGYTYLAFAEAFCSGVPLQGSDPILGLSTAGLFALAEARFSQALAAPILPQFSTLANLGTARARLGRGDFAGAGAAAALVPSGFAYATTHSSTFGNENLIFLLNQLQRRISIADREGGNGIPFRSALDSRLPWVAGGPGFDGFTPVVYHAQKFPSVSSPITIASDVEARLIGAEALLFASDVAGFLAQLNALRVTVGLPPLVDPGSPAARVDLLFSERAFWLYATGTRLGDVRRLIRNYGRTEATVLPTGAYPRGGTYGNEANLPVPMSARGPTYTGCTDRTS